jgi:orotidine-5'-phosphate decarboxylase
MNRKQIYETIIRKKSFLCVGLDTDVRKLPDCLRNRTDAVFAFNRAIVDATAPFCVAYKPNLAFYESQGLPGLRALSQTVAYIRSACPDALIIADAKRGDIGNTSEMYASAVFDTDGFDAVTVAPYMGEDSVRPFLREDKWAIVLALTSNKGSQDFQMMQDASGERLFERTLRIAKTWGTDNNMMFVVGATRGRLFADVRRIVPDHFLLVPGIGAQGGSLDETVEYGLNPTCGLLVNSSRQILYADHTDLFADAARAEAEKVQKAMAAHLRNL